MASDLASSERLPPLHSVEVSEPASWPDDWMCDVTLYLAPGAGQPALQEYAGRLLASRLGAGHLSRAELEELVRPDKSVRKDVVEVLRGAHVEHAHQVGMRAVHARARWAELQKLIMVDQRRYRTPDGLVVGRSGCVRVVDDLAAVVAVFGLDNRRALSPYVIKSHVIKSHVIKSHVIKSHAAASPERAQAMALSRAGTDHWFTPGEIAEWYRFPAGTGRGCRIGLLAFSGQLGGTDHMVAGGYRADLLRTFFAEELAMGPGPTITAERIRGPGNWPADGGDDSEFTDEVMLDLSVVGALAPDADITVYFTEPTEQGFVDALHHVVELERPPDILLICYGSPEDGGDGATWTGAAIAQSEVALAAAALRGITVVCSCGDNGAAGAPLSTRVQADFPASSAWVLGCGGTRIEREAPDRETVWNDGTGASGGGISAVVERPQWQRETAMPVPADTWRRRAGVQWRGVPDVAAVADPASGVAVVDAQGDTVVAGGTSVSAPVWAALLARCRQLAGGRLGLVTPALYGTSDGLRDIARGDNGAYAAAPDAWDPCTGLGVPDGAALSAALLARLSPGTPAAGGSAPGRA